MKKLQSKLDLLWKKHLAFGLSKTEEERYTDLKIQFNVLYEEFREAEFERVLMTYLYDRETVMALKKIQSIIPWDGGFVLRDTEFEEILDAELELTDEQREMIKDNLVFIHNRILKNFEKFALKDGMDVFLLDLAAFITRRESAGIHEVAIHIDDRYREFAEMLNIELEELEIEWRC